MKIHEVNAATAPQLQRGIDEFEATFLTPFGDGGSFRIDYGSNRTDFIRSLGDAWKCFAAEKDGRIAGLIELACIRLQTPEGQEGNAVYIADLKLLPEVRRKIVAGRLMQMACKWGMTHSDLGFTVVMDENPVNPSDYTGRAGILAFSAVARVVVVRLPTVSDAKSLPGDQRFFVSRKDAITIYQKLTRGRYKLAIRAPFERSVTQPAWFLHPAGLACGRFEDRRKVRRLIASDGSELRPAYLTCFAFADADAALELIAVALRHAGAAGFRALRVCMTEEDFSLLQKRAGTAAIQKFGATVFATSACAPGVPWNINASEI